MHITNLRNLEHLQNDLNVSVSFSEFETSENKSNKYENTGHSMAKRKREILQLVHILCVACFLIKI